MQINIKDLGDFMERFQAAMTVQQPDWFITFANEQELKDFARAAIHRLEQGNDKGLRGNPAEALKRNVAQRLTMPVRACVHAGLVDSKVG